MRSLPAVRARRRWREADAEIVYTDLDDSARREFRVEYRYEVDGREYTNDEILPGQDTVLAPDSEDLFRQYPLHRHTVIFYDPHEPARSALDLDPDELVLRPLFIGLINLAVAAAGIAMILAGWP